MRLFGRCMIRRDAMKGSALHHLSGLVVRGSVLRLAFREMVLGFRLLLICDDVDVEDSFARIR
jgi:hypothetical protein